VHELKHDGYRLQIHARDGRVRLYTMNGADWMARYPRIVEQAARIKGSAIIDAEVVWLDVEGVADFDALHSRTIYHTQSRALLIWLPLHRSAIELVRTPARWRSPKWQQSALGSRAPLLMLAAMMVPDPNRVQNKNPITSGIRRGIRRKGSCDSSRAAASIVAFLPSDLARLCGEPGSFLAVGYTAMSPEPFKDLWR
jgi:ATP dependent DNA ligase-like protein